MATLAQVIDQVRRRVADFTNPRVFENEFYQDAIEFALSKLSFDLSESYTTVPAVPTNRTFLLTKLATIEMCHMRASKAVDDGVSEETDGSEVSSITVPDLSVSGPATSDDEQAKHWMLLADRLQREYDDEISHIGGTATAAEVQNVFVRRHSLTTGGLANRKMDPGLDAVTTYATVEGNTVTVSWSKLHSPEFMLYEVYRSESADMSDAELLSTIDDNDIVEYEDTGLPVGTYYYLVKTVNPNYLKTDSAIASVEVE